MLIIKGRKYTFYTIRIYFDSIKAIATGSLVRWSIAWSVNWEGRLLISVLVKEARTTRSTKNLSMAIHMQLRRS